MKKQFLLVILFVVSYTSAQSVNDYKAFIVPVKYDFLKGENQYRLNTLTKFNLNKAGLKSFYTSETIPLEFNERCGLLYVDVVKENSFLTTKLIITMTDCNNKIIFQSAVGKSKEKDYKVAYTEALNEAFQSVYNLQYKYSGQTIKETESANEAEVNKAVLPTLAKVEKPVLSTPKITSKADVIILYAQPMANGYQLIDSTPKVIMKVFNTSINDCYIAIKGDNQGVLILKNNQWIFEYYQNDQLRSDIIAVKF